MRRAEALAPASASASCDPTKSIARTTLSAQMGLASDWRASARSADVPRRRPTRALRADGSAAGNLWRKTERCHRHGLRRHGRHRRRSRRRSVVPVIDPTQAAVAMAIGAVQAQIV